MGQARDALLGLAGRGDVGADAAEAGEHAVQVMDRLGAERPPVGFGADRHRDHDVAEGLLLGEQRGQRGHGPGRGFRRRAAQRGQRAADQGLLVALGGGGHAVGDIGQGAGVVDFPQPVAGAFLEVAEQQADDLALAFQLLAGHQAFGEHLGVRQARDAHHQVAEDQQAAQGQQDRVAAAQQHEERADHHRGRIGDGGGGQGQHGEAAATDHAGDDRGDQHAHLRAGLVGVHRQDGQAPHRTPRRPAWRVSCASPAPTPSTCRTCGAWPTPSRAGPAGRSRRPGPPRSSGRGGWDC
jgi:hypothetical protein